MAKNKKTEEVVAEKAPKKAKAEKQPEKKPAKQSKAPAADKKPGIFGRIGGYFHDVRLELKRVVWPSRSEVINSTVVVVITLIFFILFTLLVDSGIVPLLNQFAKLKG